MHVHSTDQQSRWLAPQHCDPYLQPIHIHSLQPMTDPDMVCATGQFLLPQSCYLPGSGHFLTGQLCRTGRLTTTASTNNSSKLCITPACAFQNHCVCQSSLNGMVCRLDHDYVHGATGSNDEHLQGSSLCVPSVSTGILATSPVPGTFSHEHLQGKPVHRDSDRPAGAA
jgi:hypothetical protein